MKRAIIFIIGVLATQTLWGQMFPERKMIRQGNKLYEQLNFADGEAMYRKASAESPASTEANFNLGDAQYKQQRFDQAEATLKQLSESKTMTAEQAAKVWYNLGNAQFKQQKLQEALESFKQSLRLNPADMEAKYNYAYVKKLLDKNNDDQNKNNDQNKDDQNQDQNKDNQNQDQNQDNKDQNQDQNKDNQDQNQDNQDQQNQDQNKDQNQDQNQDQSQGDKNQQQATISPDEAKQMLDAVQQAEDKTNDKVNDKRAAAVVSRSGKNW